MLDLIRRKQQSFIVKMVFWTIIAAFVGTIFLVWGKGSDRGGDPTVALTINGTTISHQDYERAYGNLYNFYQNVYRDRFNPAMEKQLGLRQQALNMLINRTLLSQEAEQKGIDVSKQEIVDSISQIAAFQKDGAFDKALYLEVLAYQRLTPSEFESIQAEDLRIEKARKALEEKAVINEGDVEEEFRKQNEKIDLSFVRLTPALVEKRVKIDEEGLKTFFKKNQESFRVPERVALKYLVFKPTDYLKEVSFTEAELEKFYRQNIDRFEIAEQVQAAHILLKVTPDANEQTIEKKRELAEKILEQIKTGSDFGKLARKYSDDAASASKGGELGYFPRGSMVDAFERAAFSLRPGEISDIVKTPFGLHIIKSQGYIEPGLKPLAEAMPEVKKGLRQEKARQFAFEKAMDAYNINRKTGDLESAAKENELGLKETDFFARGEKIDGLGKAPAINDAAFKLEKGDLARPLRLADSILLFSVSQRRESRLPELKEVRSQVEDAYRATLSDELAQELADQILKKVKEGKDLEKVISEEGFSAETTGLFSRSYGSFIPRLGSNEPMSKAAFELTDEGAAIPEVQIFDGKYVVAALKQHIEPKISDLNEEKRKELSAAILSRKKSESVNKRLEELKEKATIDLSPRLLNMIKG